MLRSRPLHIAASLLIAAVAMVFGLAPSANAHTELISTDPEPGAILLAPPHEVTLTFTDQMSGEFNTLSLLIDNTDPLVLEAVTQGNVVRAMIPTKNLADLGLEGTAAWKLVYRVVSADGHPVAGEVDFEAPLPTGPSSSDNPSEGSQATAPSEATSELSDEPETSHEPATTSSDAPSDDLSPATPFIVIAAIAIVATVAFIIFAARRRAQDRASADA